MPKVISAKDKICDAMISLMENKALDDITVKELVQRAGVNRSTYYYHFYRPIEVLDYIIEKFLDKLTDLIREFFPLVKNFDEPYPEYEIKSTNENFCKYIYNNRRILSVILNCTSHDEFVTKFLKRMQDILRCYKICLHGMDGEKKYLYSGKLYETCIYKQIYFALSVIEMWNSQRFEDSPEEMIETLESLASSHEIEFYLIKNIPRF